MEDKFGFFAELISDFLNIGVQIWNKIVGESAELYKVNPLEATLGNGVSMSSIVNHLGTTMSGIATLLVIILFLVAIIRECADFEKDGQMYVILKLIIRLIICATITENCWTIIQAIYSGVNNYINFTGASIELNVPKTVMEGLQDVNFVFKILFVLIYILIALIVAVTLITTSISIFGNAYSRIILATVLAPFAGVFFALQMATRDMQISAVPYLKTVISYVLSGPVCYIVLYILAQVFNSGGIISELNSGPIADMLLLTVYPGIAAMILPKVTDTLHRAM